MIFNYLFRILSVMRSLQRYLLNSMEIMSGRKQHNCINKFHSIILMISLCTVYICWPWRLMTCRNGVFLLWRWSQLLLRVVKFWRKENSIIYMDCLPYKVTYFSQHPSQWWHPWCISPYWSTLHHIQFQVCDADTVKSEFVFVISNVYLRE